MTLPYDALIAILLGALDDHEREAAVVYRATEPLEAGEKANVPGLDVAAARRSLLAFVDREPSANWSHSSRYLMVDLETGALTSVEARLPPFGPASERHWALVHKGQSVPEGVVQLPPNTRDRKSHNTGGS